MGYKLGGMYVSVSGDLKPMEKDLAAMRDMVAARGEDISKVFGEKVNKGIQDAANAYAEFGKKASDSLDKVKAKARETADDVTEAWYERHSGKLKLLAGAVAIAAIDSQWANIAQAADEAYVKVGSAIDGMSGKWGQFAGDIANAGVDYLFKKERDALLAWGEEAKNAIVTMDALGKKYGYAVEEISKMEWAGKVSGAATADIVAAFAGIDHALTSTDDAAKKSQLSLAAMGISLTDSSGKAKDARSVLVELSDKMASYSNIGENAAKKQQLFAAATGVSSDKLLEFANRGGEYVEQALSQAEKLGVVHTQAQANQLRNIEDQKRYEQAVSESWGRQADVIKLSLATNLNNIDSYYDTLDNTWGNFWDKQLERLLTHWEAVKEVFTLAKSWVMHQFGADEPGSMPAQLKSQGVAMGNGTAPDVPRAAAPNVPDFGGKKSGGSDKSLELTKYINSIAGAAMSEQAGFLGDKYGSQQLSAWKDYSNEIDSIRQKLDGFESENKDALEKAAWYWATYRLGIKLAKSELEGAEVTLRSWADNMERLGELMGDPQKSFTAKQEKLSLDQRAAERAIMANSLISEESRQGMLADVRQRYAMEEVALREKTMGAAVAVDDAYWARKQEALGYQFEFLKKQGVNEHALDVFMAQERDKLNKEQLEKRLGYEDSFGGYLKDRLALQYGLYEDAETQKLELWKKTADAQIKLFDGVADAFSWTLGQAFGDLATGKFKDVENYTQQLLAQLKQTFASWLTDMARIAANKYIVVPIMGQIMGTSGSLSLPGVSGLNTQGGDGFSLEGAMKYGGYAKDAYSLFGGSGGAGAASLASEAAQGANFVGPSVQLANAGVPGSAQLTTLGALGAGAAAGGIGYMAGGFIRPDNPTASYVGAGAGLAAGTIAGMAGFGALAATGIGALVAIPAALAVGLAQPNTVKSEWSVPNASKSAIMIAGGENTNAAYGVIKQTSSGAFGSSSTSHKSIFGIASPEMAAQQDAAWAAATKGLDGFTKAVGVSESELTKAKSSFNYPAIPIPDGMDAEVYRNVANAEAEHTLSQLGMLDAIKAVTKDGEAYIDTLTRLDSTFSTMENLAISTGFGLEQVAAGMDRIVAADYASRLMEAAGGADAFAGALARLNAYGYSAQEQMERSLTGTATATGRAIAEIGNAEVTIENFWPKFRAAMESGMDPDRMAAWVTASARMEQWEQVKAAWQQKDIEAIQQQTSTLQTQISVIQQVSSAWKGFGDQMVRLKQSLLMDANLSTLSPLEKMGAAKSRLDSLTAEANNKSTAHLADIDQATKDYLTSALDYYGASADYFAIFDSTSATIDQLQALAGSQVSAADQQVASLNFQIEQNNAQITALNTINSGLGDVVNAVNNVSQAIGGAIQTANAAQQAVSIPQWAASAVAADTTAAASPYAAQGDDFSTPQSYLDALAAMGWSVPGFAGGGDHRGGARIVGENGPELEVTGPARYFSASQTKKILAKDSGNSDAKLDAIGAVLVDILNVLQDGGGAGEKLDEIKRVMKSQGFVRAGA